MTIRSLAVAGMTAASLAFGAMATHAQETAPAPQTEVPTAQAAPVDETKLKSFAVAFLEVAKVNQAYQPQIQSAPNPEDQQRLQQEAGQKMIEAVNASQDITLDEYNQIIEAAQTDPELAQRINGHITEVAGDTPAEPQPAD